MRVAHRQDESSAMPTAAESTSAGLVWTSSGRTHPGAEREDNEDAYLERPDIGLWAVADGMGGHARGELASAMLVDTLRQVVRPAALSAYVDEVEDRILGVNTRLREYAAERGLKTIGATVAALLVFQDVAVCLWAGDSRIYRYRNKRLQQLTRDHALVEDLVGMGIVKRAHAENHPHANLVTRAVGAVARLCLDIDVWDVRAGDVFLLCSDGLSRELSDKAIANTLRKQASKEASSVLIEMALARGARDNVTAIIVRALAPPSPAAENDQGKQDPAESFTASP